MNQRLMEQLPEGQFVTLLLGVYDMATHRLEYVDAGHVPAFVSSKDGQITLLTEPKNTILGVVQETYLSGACPLEPGCGVLAVTDGITETTAGDGREFGIEGVQAALAGKTLASADALVQHVVAAATALRADAPRQDDITALALLRT